MRWQHALPILLAGLLPLASPVVAAVPPGDQVGRNLAVSTVHPAIPAPSA